MKLMYFNDFRLGVLKGAEVVDVTAAVQNVVPHTTPGNLIIGVIEQWASVRGRIESAAKNRSFRRDSKGNLVSEISKKERKRS